MADAEGGELSKADQYDPVIYNGGSLPNATLSPTLGINNCLKVASFYRSCCQALSTGLGPPAAKKSVHSPCFISPLLPTGSSTDSAP